MSNAAVRPETAQLDSHSSLCMTRRSQREEELHHLTLLQQHCSELTDHVFTLQQPPDPDFCAEGPTGRIGIELTEFSGNLLVRREEGEQDGVIQRAQELYQATGLPDVHVVVNWRHEYRPSKRDRTLATFLTEMVSRNRPSMTGETVILDPTSEATTHLDHPAFERVWVFGVDDPLPWTSIHRWSGRAAGPELVQREIDRKSAKPEGYRQSYTQRWLVIVHPGDKPSTGFDLGAEITSHEFTANFDCVLVFSLTPARVLRLRLRN